MDSRLDSNDRGSYWIGELAARVDMSVEGLRYYERIGILPEPRRTGSGYRVYDDEDLRRLRFVKAAQELGFTLKEIRALLRLRDGDQAPCGEVKEKLEEKLGDVRRKLELLRGFEADLEAAIDCCREQLRQGDTDCCPVVVELSDGRPG